MSREVNIIPNESIEAQLKLQAERKLAPILKSKKTTEKAVSTADVVEEYSKYDDEKCRKWSNREILLSI